MQRILVIDDDPAITSLLKRGLSYEGFQVDIASNGEAGLALGRQFPPDLAILDMPVAKNRARKRLAEQLTGRGQCESALPGWAAKQPWPRLSS